MNYLIMFCVSFLGSLIGVSFSIWCSQKRQNKELRAMVDETNSMILGMFADKGSTQQLDPKAKA